MGGVVRGVLIGLLCLAVSGGLAAVFVRTSRASAEIQKVRAELSRLARARARPEVVIREVRTESAPIHEDGVEASTSSSGDIGAESRAKSGKELTPEERKHRGSVMRKAELAAIAGAFAAEKRDADWSEGALRRLEGTFAAAEDAGVNTAIDCRTTLCRVDFSYGDSDDGSDVVRRLSNPQPWPRQRFTKLDLEKREGVMYLTREDHRLPEVDVSSLEY